jgi:hypothetical protein
MIGIRGWPWPRTEAGASIIGVSVANLIGRIHHEGPVLHNGFVERLALEQKQISRMNGNEAFECPDFQWCGRSGLVRSPDIENRTIRFSDG